MINLLPQEHKKLITTEYRLRVVTIILAMLLVLITSGAVLLIPSYVLSMYKRNAAENAPDTSTTEVQREYAELMARIQHGKSLIRNLQPEKSHVTATDIINRIIKFKTADTILNEINYVYSGETSFTVEIRGVAKTRQSLLNFEAALENDPDIAEIDLPVSLLAKDANINFSIELTNEVNPKP
jgi:hypothetical protein